MTQFVKKTSIQAPVAHVWRTLADLGTIAEWNPGVKSSKLEGDQKEGVGAGRSCQVKGGYLMEKVTLWEPNKSLGIQVTDTNLPMKRVEPRYELHEVQGATHVKLHVDYELRYGIIGKMMDKMMVNRQLQNGMQEQLDGLKAKCEREAKTVATTS